MIGWLEAIMPKGALPTPLPERWMCDSCEVGWNGGSACWVCGVVGQPWPLRGVGLRARVAARPPDEDVERWIAPEWVSF